MMTIQRITYVLQRAPGTAPVFAIGLIGALILGSWWTGQAVADGKLASMLARLGLSGAAALYYYVLLQISRGHNLKFVSPPNG